MKMFFNGTPINSMNAHCLEIPTDDATVQPSDVQAGITYYARGTKGVGTGKSFEFAYYGTTTTNIQEFIPTLINVVEITGLDYPVKSTIALSNMKNIDFTKEQTIAIAVVDNVEYPITIKIDGYILTFNCEKTIRLSFFYGRDNYA